MPSINNEHVLNICPYVLRSEIGRRALLGGSERFASGSEYGSDIL